MKQEKAELFVCREKGCAQADRTFKGARGLVGHYHWIHGDTSEGQRQVAIQRAKMGQDKEPPVKRRAHLSTEVEGADAVIVGAGGVVEVDKKSTSFLHSAVAEAQVSERLGNYVALIETRIAKVTADLEHGQKELEALNLELARAKAAKRAYDSNPV